MRAWSREKASTPRVPASARASASRSRSSAVSGRPVRTHRATARSRATASADSAAASSAAAPGSSTGGGSGATGPASGSGSPAPRRVTSASASRSTSTSPAADLLEEPGDRGRIGGRDAVPAQLDGPERAEVAVALVGQGVVQGRRAVVDLGVQLRRGGRGGVEPVALGQEADQGVQRGGDGVAVVVEQRDGAREPDGQRVRDVGARPPGQAPVDAVAVVQRGRDQRRLAPGCPGAGPSRPRETADARGRPGTPHDRRDRRRGAPVHHTRRRGARHTRVTRSGTPRRAPTARGPPAYCSGAAVRCAGTSTGCAVPLGCRLRRHRSRVPASRPPLSRVWSAGRARRGSRR